MATRHVHSAKEVLGDRPRYGVVVRCERSARFNTKGWIQARHKEESRERKCSLSGTRLNDKTLRADGTSPKLGCAIKEFRSVCAAVMREREPFWPTSTVLVDLERVGANLGFEERVGNRVLGGGKG